MAELIRKPRAKVERRAVEAALLRLLRYPGTTSVGMVMRMVDEYAASQHTELVYRHAEKIVAAALVEAARLQDRGEKIFVCENFDDHEKNFLDGKKIFARKKIFKSTFPPAAPPFLILDENPANPTSPESHKCQECPECQGCSQCPIWHETSVRDTSGRTTAVRDTSDTDTFVLDTRDTVTAATGKGDLTTGASDTDPGKGTLATDAEDKGTLATAVPDTSGERPVGRVRPVDVSTPRASVGARKVDKPTCESGKNEADAGAPDALADGAETIKACTRCGRVLPLSAYVLARGRKGGRASACRECEQQRHRDYRAAKREQRQNGAPEGQKQPSERP